MDAATNRNDVAKRSLWIALLTGATFIGSLIFACATPFPALGALAALHMRKRDAFVLTGVNWLANQIVGYGFLHYPQTWDSFAWGGAIGIGAFVATALAIALRQMTTTWNWAVMAVAVFAAAFVGYELTLYAATAFLPSEPAAFGAKIVTYIFEVNGLAFAGLLVLQGLGQSAGIALRASTT